MQSSDKRYWILHALIESPHTLTLFETLERGGSLLRSEMMEKTELSYRHRSFDGFNLILGLGMPKPVAPLFAKMAPFIFLADIGKKNLLFSDYKTINVIAQVLFGIMLE